MKKLTEEEFAKLEFVKRGVFVGRNAPIYAELKKLKVGEKFFFEQREWKTKAHPSVSISQSMRDGRRFAVRKVVNNGWVVIRKV